MKRISSQEVCSKCGKRFHFKHSLIVNELRGIGPTKVFTCKKCMKKQKVEELLQVEELLFRDFKKPEIQRLMKNINNYLKDF